MALIVTETIESTQAPLRGDSSGRSLRQNPRKKRHFDEIAGSPPPPQPRKKRSPVPKQGSKIEKGSAAESAARVLVSYSAQAHQESPDESLVECEIDSLVKEVANLKYGHIFTTMTVSIGGLVDDKGSYINGPHYTALDLKIDHTEDAENPKRVQFLNRQEAFRVASLADNAQLTAALDARFPDRLSCVDGEVRFHAEHDTLVLQDAFCTRKALALDTSMAFKLQHKTGQRYSRPAWHGFSEHFPVFAEAQWNTLFSKMILVAEPCLLLKLEALLHQDFGSLKGKLESHPTLCTREEIRRGCFNQKNNSPEGILPCAAVGDYMSFLATCTKLESLYLVATNETTSPELLQNARQSLQQIISGNHSIAAASTESQDDTAAGPWRPHEVKYPMLDRVSSSLMEEPRGWIPSSDSATMSAIVDADIEIRCAKLLLGLRG